MGMFSGWFSQELAIDLGTCNTLVYVKGQGVVINEPSIVAVQNQTGRVVAVGLEAKEMLGRTPEYITAIQPLRDGVIADFDATEKMLRHFIEKANRRKRSWSRPRILVAVPSRMTQVEERAVRESAQAAGAGEVLLVKEPMAAAIGAGLDIEGASGNIVVDIGGGTTEVAVLSLAGIVYADSCRVGGNQMDLDIIHYIRRKHNLLIGERTAEEIKMELGAAMELDEQLAYEIGGRDVRDGLPKTIYVTNEMILEALGDSVNSIVEFVRNALEHSPPELSADFINNGIMLAGGGAKLKKLDLLLRERTGLPCSTADDPLTCVALGAGKILDEPKLLKKIYG